MHYTPLKIHYNNSYYSTYIRYENGLTDNRFTSCSLYTILIIVTVDHALAFGHMTDNYNQVMVCTGSFNLLKNYYSCFLTFM